MKLALIESGRASAQSPWIDCARGSSRASAPPPCAPAPGADAARIATPAWVDDRVSVAAHVRAAPVALTDDPADRLRRQPMAQRLDHSGPLWCIDVADPPGRPHRARDSDPSLPGRRRHRGADALRASLGHRFRPRWRGPGSGGRGLRLGSRACSPPGSPAGCVDSAARLSAGPEGDLARSLAAVGTRARRPSRDSPPRALAARRRYGVRSLDRRRSRGRLHGLRARRSERIEHAVGPGVTINDVVLAMSRARSVAGSSAMTSPSGPCGSRSRSACITETSVPRARQSRLLPVLRPAGLRARPPQAPSGDQRRDPDSQADHDPAELYSSFHILSHIRPLYRFASELPSGPREFALSVSNVPAPGRRSVCSAPTSPSSTRSPNRPTGTPYALRRSRSRTHGLRLLHRPPRGSRHRRPRRRPRCLARGAGEPLLSPSPGVE